MNLRKKAPSDLDNAIATVYARMHTIGPDDPDYAKLVMHVKELESIKGAKRSNRPSPDTVWIVLGAVAQVGIMVAYEHSHVIVTKAAGYILKTQGSTRP